METATKLLLLLNSADAGFTAWYVTHGEAHEINPLMQYLLSVDVLLFLAFKLVAVNGLILALERVQSPRKQLWFDGLTLLYGLVFALHLLGAFIS